MIERTWQKAWADARLFEAHADPDRPKWYSNVPYPYMSGYQHLGFGLSFLRAEFQSRFRRMAGYNVLHPQAFHCTGLPILGAAARVAEKEPRQIAILRGMGVPAREIPRFGDPMHWIETFPQATRADLEALGAAVDWRRSFITTPLNPPYDAFVRWQFRRLREGGYVRKDKHPVVWCPKDQAPIGDHDRLEGEGETPVEFTLLKFPLPDGRLLVAATIRPETVFGQTNLWIDPGVEYVLARVDGERWILNELATKKLAEQGKDVAAEGRLRGRDLVGKEVVAPGINRAIPILPSTFIDQGRGTGIVTSVPSDAPDDYVALRDLQEDGPGLRKYGLDPGRILAIRPIPIIRTPGWGPLPGVEVVERMGIRSQKDREKLEAAKAEVYRSGFYTGVMNENCGHLAGVRVEVAKDEVRKQLVGSRQADTLFEPSGDVVCRCTTPAIVKLVEDQWFLAYADPAWKAKVHEALGAMTLYPDAIRKQFDYVVDWLRDWPCAHHRGLGTALPWDAGWVIESLSDSTVYMAYYTIAHRLQDGRLRSEVPWASRLDDAFFDYVFRGEGDPRAVASRLGVEPRLVEEMRAEFRYWYPFELRNTGKDLVQNHMTFCLFNHTALFPKELWPRGFGINGWVRRAGRKMSKSRGNTWYIRDAVKEWGADVVRMMVANAGDGQDDPNLDVDFADSIRGRLEEWLAVATRRTTTRSDRRPIDAWFLSVLHRAVRATRAAMESMNYKAALRHGYFDLQTAWAWYVRRSGNRPRADVVERFREVQTRILSPFTPHLSEEVWSRLGRHGFVSAAPYPEPVEAEIDPAAEAGEDLLQATLTDVREILKVTKLTPTRVALYTAPAWMRRVRAIALDLGRTGAVPINALIEKALSDPGMRERAKEVAAYAKKVADELRHRRPAEAPALASVEEFERFSDDLAFLRTELGARVDVYRADDPSRWDPKARAGLAVPGRPAIYVE
ncbi:MAG: leucine--tRNA ligase [Methanobacteriota archaeon]